MPLSSTYILIGRYLIKFVYTNLPTCISNQVVEPYPSGINMLKTTITGNRIMDNTETILQEIPDFVCAFYAVMSPTFTLEA